MSKNMLGKNDEQDAVDPRLTLFNFDIFAKCIACLIGLPRRTYGQIAIFSNLPVKPGLRLRANPRFLKSARKTRLPLTGKSPFFQICP